MDREKLFANIGIAAILLIGLASVIIGAIGSTRAYNERSNPVVFI